MTRVYKFGGTCLADEEGRGFASLHCRRCLEAGDGLVVVVSAMGRAGDPYSTDTLLAMAPTAGPRERDNLAACGEIAACAVMAERLRTDGVRAEALTGWEAGIATDGAQGSAEITAVDTSRIRECLAGGVTPVVAGFQGAWEGRATTLGRGGSDTSAIALAAALGASEAVLFKNVDSVFTADPSIVPGALRIERIGAEDLRQMSWQGAKVVHPSAVEIAMQAALPVEVRRHACGSLVTRIEPFVLRSGRYITGVASGPDVISIRAAGGAGDRGFYARVFGLVAGAGISMDMFSVMDGTAMFTVSVADAAGTCEVLGGAGVACSGSGPCSKVSIVGAGMHGMRGVMARFSQALESRGIGILQTVDSHATISALVRLEDRDEALRALHAEFLER